MILPLNLEIPNCVVVKPFHRSLTLQFGGKSEDIVQSRVFSLFRTLQDSNMYPNQNRSLIGKIKGTVRLYLNIRDTFSNSRSYPLLIASFHNAEHQR